MKRVAIAALLVCSGCFDIDFDPAHLVKTPRILNIVASPPESAFGTDVRFDALVVDELGNDLTAREGVEMRWFVCISLAEVVGSAGLSFGTSLEDSCGEGGDDLVRLRTGGELPTSAAVLPGSAFLGLVEELQRQAAGGGGGAGGQTLDPQIAQTLALIVQEVGIAFRMRLEVWRGGERILLGFKRFAVTQRANPTTNPPAPRFAIGGTWISARASTDGRCVPEVEGEPLRVVAGAEVDMAPDELEEAWLERYPVVGLEGTVLINDEGAYYSWFSTGGEFEDEITLRPQRNTVWTAPETAGTYPVWLVVRDGHLGASHCRADVEVTPAE